MEKSKVERLFFLKWKDVDGMLHMVFQVRNMIWVFPKIGVPQHGWFIMERLIKMDDLGVPLFSETPICFHNICFLVFTFTVSTRQPPTMAPPQPPSMTMAERVMRGHKKNDRWNKTMTHFLQELSSLYV